MLVVVFLLGIYLCMCVFAGVCGTYECEVYVCEIYACGTYECGIYVCGVKFIHEGGETVCVWF